MNITKLSSKEWDKLRSVLSSGKHTALLEQFIRENRDINDDVLRILGKYYDFKFTEFRYRTQFNMLEMGYSEKDAAIILEKAHKKRRLGKVSRSLGEKLGTSLALEFPCIWIYQSARFAETKAGSNKEKYKSQRERLEAFIDTLFAAEKEIKKAS